MRITRSTAAFLITTSPLTIGACAKSTPSPNRPTTGSLASCIDGGGVSQ
jgi:hypothetical protein